jgi:hypothetical protein
MSFRDIGAVTRNASEELDKNSIECLVSRDNMSRESQALELFLQGKKPIEVAVIPLHLLN